MRWKKPTLAPQCSIAHVCICVVCVRHFVRFNGISCFSSFLVLISCLQFWFSWFAPQSRSVYMVVHKLVCTTQWMGSVYIYSVFTCDKQSTKSLLTHTDIIIINEILWCEMCHRFFVLAIEIDFFTFRSEVNKKCYQMKV